MGRAGTRHRVLREWPRPPAPRPVTGGRGAASPAAGGGGGHREGAAGSAATCCRCSAPGGSARGSPRSRSFPPRPAGAARPCRLLPQLREFPAEPGPVPGLSRRGLLPGSPPQPGDVGTTAPESPGLRRERGEPAGPQAPDGGTARAGSGPGGSGNARPGSRRGPGGGQRLPADTGAAGRVSGSPRCHRRAGQRQLLFCSPRASDLSGHQPLSFSLFAGRRLPAGAEA